MGCNYLSLPLIHHCYVFANLTLSYCVYMKKKYCHLIVVLEAVLVEAMHFNLGWCRFPKLLVIYVCSFSYKIDIVQRMYRLFNIWNSVEAKWQKENLQHTNNTSLPNPWLFKNRMKTTWLISSCKFEHGFHTDLKILIILQNRNFS